MRNKQEQDDSVLRLDATEISSIYISDINKVDKWEDLSGNENHLTKENNASRPSYNGSDGIIFTGNNYLSRLSQTNTIRNNITSSTWTCIFNVTEVYTQQIIYAVGYPTSNVVYMPIFRVASGSLFCTLFTTAATGVAITVPISPNTTYIATVVWNRPDFYLYLNGVAVGSSTGATMELAELFSERMGTRNNAYQNYLNGEIKYLSWYDRTIEDPERANMESYLMNKFNI